MRLEKHAAILADHVRMDSSFNFVVFEQIGLLLVVILCRSSFLVFTSACCL